MVKGIRRALDGRGWKCVRNVVAVVAFCVIVLNILCGLSWMLRDDENMSAYALYSENPAGDVIFLGTSHVYNAVIPQLLYDEYGITAHLLATPTQRLAASYALARESIKTNKPKVIVLDAYGFMAPYTHSRDNNVATSQIIRSKVKGEDLVRTQVRDIVAARVLHETDPLKYEMAWRLRDKDVPLELISAAISGHSDFWSLSRAKLTYNGRQLRSMDYLFSKTIWSPDELTDKAVPYSPEFIGGGVYFTFTDEQLSQAQLAEENLYWFNEIITLCKNNGVALLMSAYPYFENEAEKKLLTQLQQICAQKDVGFIPMESFDAVIDERNDFWNMGHTNYYGATKVTSYLGQYIKDNYDVKDARNDGDARYARWRDNQYSYIARCAESILPECNTLDDFLHVLSDMDESYIVILATEGDCVDNLTTEQRVALTSLGFETLIDETELCAINLGSSSYKASSYENCLLTNVDGHRIDVNSEGSAFISIDNMLVSVQHKGIKLVVYDRYDNKAIDSVAFGADTSGLVLRN